MNIFPATKFIKIAKKRLVWNL